MGFVRKAELHLSWKMHPIKESKIASNTQFMQTDSIKTSPTYLNSLKRSKSDEKPLFYKEREQAAAVH